MQNSYFIMHKDRHVATFNSDGTCSVFFPSFMPYNLYLEQNKTDIDSRLNNINNFNYWCASRVLTLDRKYAKEILNTLGKKQAITDKDRAEIALSYHSLSLTDVYWTKSKGENITFAEINLYENLLLNSFVDVCLRGNSLTLANEKLLESDVAGDVATSGVSPKAWVRKDDGIYLYKDGDELEVKAEILASKIADCFDCKHVKYEENIYDNQKVSASKLMTSIDKSIVAMEFIEVYAANHNKDKYQIVKKLDKKSYYMMNIIDYLVGNIDRHWGNWGFLIDNNTNKMISLHPLIDFNKSFKCYDTIDGAKCLTTNKNLTQKESAILAVKEIGLNQIKDIDSSWFYDDSIKDMFFNRLKVLKEASR